MALGSEDQKASFTARLKHYAKGPNPESPSAKTAGQ
jgi:hypothetical protein